MRLRKDLILMKMRPGQPGDGRLNGCPACGQCGSRIVTVGGNVGYRTIAHFRNCHLCGCNWEQHVKDFMVLLVRRWGRPSWPRRTPGGVDDGAHS